MTLQASGAISLQDLIDEFGGTGAVSLSDYYRGGSLVPDTDINAGIPTSGTINLSDFYGSSGAIGVLIDPNMTGYVQGFITDGGGSNVIAADTDTTPRRSITAPNDTWLSKNTLTNVSTGGVHLTGTTVMHANETVAVGPTNYMLRDTTAYSSTSTTTIQALPGTGTASGIQSIASDGSRVWCASGNVHWTTTNPTAGTPSWTQSVQGSVTGTNAMRYFSNAGVWLEWSPSFSPYYSYTTSGTSWTAGPFPLSPNEQLGIYAMGIAVSGSTKYIVMVGQKTGSVPGIWTKSGTGTISSLLGNSTWTSRTVPSELDGTRCSWVEWIPDANSGSGYWVVADNNANFARATISGATWTHFQGKPIGLSNQNVTHAVDMAGSPAYSLWGLLGGDIIRIKADEIP